jgi:primosomal protein N' (replication factor Y)
MAESLERKAAKTADGKSAVIGPAPCFFSKVDGKYRWQIVLRGGDPGAQLEGQRLADWRIEIDPVSLL